MKYLYTLVILHSRDCRYYGFRLICHATGNTVEAQVSGGESNVRQLMYSDTCGGWRSDTLVHLHQVKEKELFALPYARCVRADLHAHCVANGITLPA